jgi:putative DNA primase/helicase
VGVDNVIFCPSLADAFAQVGMTFPSTTPVLGKLVRFSTRDKSGDPAGWCKLFDDGIGAAFGCNRKGSSFVWQQRDANAPPPSKQERQAAAIKFDLASKHADRERAAKRSRGAEMATRILTQAVEPDVVHPYMTRKGITPFAARKAHYGSIVLPVHGTNGALQSLQFIHPDGIKRFLPQARMKGGRLFLGKSCNGEPMMLSAGWATGCSLHAATGEVVVVGFSGSNLAVVTADLRRQFPVSPLRVAADLDTHSRGLEYAQAAAAAGAPTNVLLPAFADGRSHGDFNDLHQVEGLDVVRRQLAVTADTSNPCSGSLHGATLAGMRCSRRHPRFPSPDRVRQCAAHARCPWRAAALRP